MTTVDGDEDDVFVCYDCVGDPHLKGEIRRDGSRRPCQFCRKKRKAWPLRELAERVRGVIEEHFRLTPSDPGAEGFPYDKETQWERRGEPVEWVITEIAAVEPDVAEAIRRRISEATSWDAFAGAYEDPFGLEGYYEEGRPDTHDFRESWEFFRREIKTRSRFFGRPAQRALEEIFGDLDGLKTWEGTPAIKEISPADDGRFLYRGRIAYSESDLHEILTSPVEGLGPPPPRFARAGRMNAAGISVFYGAMDADTCIAEVRAPVGSYVVVGRFEITRPLRVLDLDVLTKVVTGGSWFDPEFTTRSNRAAFLRHLVDEIGRPIMPRDEEFEYLPTQAVAEYLAACVEPRLDGIIFHSAQTAGKGRNVVLFHHAAGVGPYNLPEGTTIEINMGWASEDDYDDTIFISENVPPEARDEHSDRALEHGFLESLWPTSRRGAADEELIIYREPSLKLDVPSINVLKIRAVSYEQSTRSIHRHRRSKEKDAPF